MRTRSLYAILIGIAVTSLTVGTVYAAFNESTSPGTNFPGANTMYPVKVTPGSNYTIGHIVVKFPTGFVLSSARVFNIQNIGPGHLSYPNSTSVSYDVTSPVQITSGIQVVLLLGNINNTSTLGSGQTVTFVTQDQNGNPKESGTSTISIVSPIPDITDTGGKVGIGTTTPAQKLEVNGNIQVDSNIMEGSAQTLKIIPASNQAICIGTGC